MRGKVKVSADKPTNHTSSARLLLNVAEELKVPFLQIARKAEIGQITAKPELSTIQVAAETALNLLENYTLGVRMSLEGYETNLEPVSVPAVLYDTSTRLRALAKSYGVSLELSIAGRYGPVMANKAGLEAALVSLGAALIEALPAQGAGQLKLHLASHRSPAGVVAGLYGQNKQISSEVLKNGRKLQNSSRQPLTNISHTSGAGIFVADALLDAMDLNLHSSRHQGLYGLGIVLKPSRQLELV
ncbi:hypothetical protein EBZ57_03250 [bacterium]|nr:hypothetical protein [bacterium]